MNKIKSSLIHNINWFENQPKIVQDIASEKINKILSWEIDFYLYEGYPIIYYNSNWNYYLLKDSYLYQVWSFNIDESKLENITLDEFDNITNLWTYLKEKFFELTNLNKILNSLESKEINLDILSDLVEKNFTKEEYKRILQLIWEVFSYNYELSYARNISLNNHIIFFMIKLIENWVSFKDLEKFLIKNKSKNKIYEDKFYDDYELFYNLFELVNAYYIFFENFNDREVDLVWILKNITDEKIKQELNVLLELNDLKKIIK